MKSKNALLIGGGVALLLWWMTTKASAEKRERDTRADEITTNPDDDDYAATFGERPTLGVGGLVIDPLPTGSDVTILGATETRDDGRCERTYWEPETSVYETVPCVDYDESIDGPWIA